MKIVFLGTPEFATKPLMEIINKGFNVVACVSQPDKPVGRKQILEPTEVKKVALKYNIPCYQYNSISKEGVEDLKKLDADVFITCAFGQMLSKEVLDIPKLGVFNIHGSILPKYRGASPIQWTIINGEQETGITILKSDVGMDDGDILLTEKTSVLHDETSEELFERLGELSKTAIIKALNLLNSGNFVLEKQNHNNATFTHKLTKDMSKVDFNNNSSDVANYINGINMWPVAKIKIENNNLKVYKAHNLSDDEIKKLNLNSNFNVGEVALSSNKHGLIVKCKNGFVRLTEVQPENGKRMLDINFLNGKRIKLGSMVSNE